MDGDHERREIEAGVAPSSRFEREFGRRVTFASLHRAHARLAMGHVLADSRNKHAKANERELRNAVWQPTSMEYS